MAGYGYMNRGYTGYTDDRNKKTYGESGYFDPASRPTIFEAEGRKRPIVSYSPNPGSESYITTSTDRTLEYGRPPMEPVKDYGYTDNKWRNHPYSGEHDNYGRNEPPAMINQGGGLGQNFGPRFEGGEGQMYKKSEPKYPSRDTRVSGPTNDIGKAMEILQEAAKTSPVSVATAVAQPWSGTAPASTVPRRETYTPNPASRYGSFNLSSRPY
ncbi:hypothetical protein CsSME_00023439 [Camellia sinensis var. sinensis]